MKITSACVASKTKQSSKNLRADSLNDTVDYSKHEEQVRIKKLGMDLKQISNWDLSMPE